MVVNIKHIQTLIIMLTCSIMGGVGNQLFQVAFAYATAKRCGRECILLDNQFAGAGQGRHISSYYNTLFCKIRRHGSNTTQTFEIHEQQFAYHSIQEDIINAQLPADSLIVAKGYFQSEKYFPNMREELKQLFLSDESLVSYFKQSDAKYAELLQPNDFCYIGVRRGDYLKHPHIHNPCPISYYEEAMQRIPASKYYIASDDIEWCKENFKGPQFVFFEGLDDYTQLLLGTLFNKYIISNSSYHWWASYLSRSPKPLIVAPDKWLTTDKPGDTCETIYRPEMIVLNR